MSQPEDQSKSRNDVQPSEEETAALRLIESQHHDDDCDAHAYTTPESMRAALLKAFQLGARHESSPSETADTDVPLCGGCAQAWFTERDRLPGDQRCVVCAFLGNPDCDANRQGADG